MSGVRFSKAALVDALRIRVDKLNEGHNFDASNGYSQVVGKGEDMNRAYGEWDALGKLVAEIEDGIFP